MSGPFTAPRSCPGACLPGWFERRRLLSTVRRDRDIFTVLCALDGPITAKRVGEYVGAHYQSVALNMMNDLLREGHMRLVSAPRRKPKTFEWVD